VHTVINRHAIEEHYHQNHMEEHYHQNHMSCVAGHPFEMLSDIENQFDPEFCIESLHHEMHGNNHDLDVFWEVDIVDESHLPVHSNNESLHKLCATFEPEQRCCNLLKLYNTDDVDIGSLHPFRRWMLEEQLCRYSNAVESAMSGAESWSMSLTDFLLSPLAQKSLTAISITLADILILRFLLPKSRVLMTFVAIFLLTLTAAMLTLIFGPHSIMSSFPILMQLPLYVRLRLPLLQVSHLQLLCWC